MALKGTYKFAYDRERVWGCITDFDFLRSVIPALRHFREIRPNEWQGKLPLNWGPINDKIKITVSLRSIDHPQSFQLRVKTRRFAPAIKLRTTVRLYPDECQTSLRYKVRLNIAAFPPGIFDGAAEHALKHELEKILRKIDRKCRKEKNYAH